MAVVEAVKFPKAVLFDLDGTLLDSAPDMVAAIDAMRARRNQPPMALTELRPHVSKGGRAMVAAAFPEVPEDERQHWLPEFLDSYEQALGRHSVLFDGVDAMLAALEQSGCIWGIVTNKPEYLARQVIPVLGWETRCAVLIGGDTLSERKPHPLPLLVAAECIGVAPEDCVYVGDDERDIVAARAAGMPSVVALWGYRLDGDDPSAWQGDVMIETPSELLRPDAWPVTR
ncbi:phosphoglycolate phosphatase [Lysobacter sp. MMG2]|uniref:phosphoglycolate phosphatase n=1 Tax=Lysobacter sp. MMG2 TaxID=2801338 RepID=UPI001C21BF2B|nr:phosphoglycolate phosphatase [Lysobacter sp. MMG2]MBU8976170.1 phosphoglycolate phosphatase [Lysobacter sp. MMG2]